METGAQREQNNLSRLFKVPRARRFLRMVLLPFHIWFPAFSEQHLPIKASALILKY
jgi:hypothetical protein